MVSTAPDDDAFFTFPPTSRHYPNRDKLGRITEKIETIARPGGGTDNYSTVYTYDSIGRLGTVTVTGDATYSATYDYDANGNRIEAPNLNGTAVHDPQDRLRQYGTAGPTFEYTANGDLSTKTSATEVTQYEYDAIGNLRNVTVAAPGGAFTEIAYAVDASGRRIGRTVDGVPQQGLLYDDQLRIVAELDGMGQVVARFAYGTGINVPEFMQKGGQTYRIVTDHLGSVRLVVNAADGSIAQRVDYDEFGRATLIYGAWSVQPLGFAGGLVDPDTQLVRFGRRDYDPATGRWTTKDSIGFGGGDTNLYAYVGNDPINITDTTGLRALCRWLQETGEYYCYEIDSGDELARGRGYSGAGAGKNNPGRQGEPNVGPIPKGGYGMGAPKPDGGHMGPYVIPLTPGPGNKTPRSGFFIHGDSVRNPGGASQGCPIMPRAHREAIGNAGGGTFLSQ